MKTKGNFSILIVALMAVISGCNKNELSNPTEVILGKWELIAQGAKENEMKAVEPNGTYTEFFSDGILRFYNPIEDRFYDGTYKIDKNFLYYGYEKTYEQGRFDYRYRITKNQLKMTYHNGIIELIYGHPTIFIYQRK